MEDLEKTVALDHKTPPATVREVGIHLVYMSKNMADISKKLDDMSGTFAHRQELLDAITQRKADMNVFREEFNTSCKQLSSLDEALDKKADKTSLDSLATKLWSVVMAVIVAFISMIVYLIQGK